MNKHYGYDMSCIRSNKCHGCVTLIFVLQDIVGDGNNNHDDYGDGDNESMSLK